MFLICNIKTQLKKQKMRNKNNLGGLSQIRAKKNTSSLYILR
jgi:hypothetical protein